ncbi:sugar ABC transporter ATP-binding protein [Salinarimonas soli]|uniref:Sugar ABC transporter ATP-binding protein n=1 Tax=Salinarimonas soli TaxID=1638099 RepID=A0A5B2V9H9_9HYPH|nr:sugar ABC transporter ATP-binding protein [Salinarimonas soli]KAA2235634.1 sugar ABC transporter ATP-binding protein [Salinarimonas soli]
MDHIVEKTRSRADGAGVAPFLAVKDIHKRFGGVHALRGVSVTITPGQVYHLLGENGCGKSTLIKILSGVHRPDEGVIELAGREHRSLSAIEALEAGVETVYQDLSLLPNLSVAENVGLSQQLVRAHGRLATVLDRGLLADTARRALSAVNLPTSEDFLSTAVGDLPLAIRQLVAIARAIAVKARLVIMDEPTTSLTRREVDNLIDVVRSLQQDGVAVLFVTHKLDECYQIGGEAIIFRDGRCVAQGPMSSFSKEELSRLMTGRVVDGARYRQAKPAGATVLRATGLTSGERLREASFSLAAGEILGITGLLDSGRNELARVLAGVQRSTAGSIEIDGAAARIESPRDAQAHGVAYVPEDRLTEGLFLDKPIETNLVALVLDRLRGAFGGVDRKRARMLGARFVADLKIATPDLDRAVSALSGGNQQRVVIGRALSNQPRILVLHGPTVGVDVGSKDSIYRVVQSLAEDGMAVVIVSDDLPELLQNCDRILVLRAGRVVSDLPADTADEDAILKVMVATDDAVAHAGEAP